MPHCTRRDFLRGLSLIVVPAVAPAFAQESSADATWERITKTKTIKVGIFNQAPYGYMALDGTTTGESVEAVRASLRPYGIVNIEAMVTDFGALVPGLVAGRFDAICAGLYINPTRCQQVAFGNPEIQMGEAFLVKKGNPKKLHSYTDVKDRPDAKIGVNGGTAEFQLAHQVGIPEDRIVVFSDNAALVAGLRAGRVDCAGLTVGSVISTLAKAGDSDMERALPFTAPLGKDGKEIKGYGAVAFRKGDNMLRSSYNAGLAKIRESGELLAILQRFGLSASELPPADRTPEQLCVA